MPSQIEPLHWGVPPQVTGVNVSVCAVAEKTTKFAEQFSFTQFGAGMEHDEYGHGILYICGRPVA